MKKEASDRRRFERVNVSCDIRYSLDSPPDVVMRFGDDEKRAEMVNISEGGMGILTEVPLPEMTKLNIDFMLAAGRKKKILHALGQICYALALVDQIRYHMGIEFIAVKEKDRLAIADFVRARRRRRMKDAVGYSIVMMVLAASFLSRAWAQSTLEYATLISETSAAAAGAVGHKKNQTQNGEEGASGQEGSVRGAMDALYGPTGDIVGQKGVGLLGRLGTPQGVSVPAAPIEPAAVAPQARPDSPAPQAAEGPKSVRLFLRNGLAVSGSLVEENKDYVKVDSAGVVVTYFTDEIDRIE